MIDDERTRRFDEIDWCLRDARESLEYARNPGNPRAWITLGKRIKLALSCYKELDKKLKALDESKTT